MKKILQVLLLTLGMFALAVVLTASIQYLCKYFGHKYTSNIDFALLPNYLVLILRVLIYPILEELSFRLPVRNNSKSNFLYSSVSVTALLILGKFGFNSINPVLIVTLVLSILIFATNFHLNIYSLVAVYTIFFSLAHNFAFTNIGNFYIHFLIFISHAVSGLFYAYIRMKFGVIFSSLSHITVNTIPVVFSLIIRG